MSSASERLAAEARLTTRRPLASAARLTSHGLFALVLLLSAGGVGCWEQWSESWFPQMKWQKAIGAFEEVRFEGRVAAFTPPEGAVALDALEPPVGRLDTVAAAQITNPIEPDFKSVGRGQELYGVYCQACHGRSGNGDGPVSIAGERQGPFIGVFPVATATGQSDGFIYNLIRIGNGGVAGYRMPAYDRIPAEDRWHIVNYVRYLQRGGQP